MYSFPLHSSRPTCVLDISWAFVNFAMYWRLCNGVNLFSQVSTNKQTIFFGVVVYFDLTFSPVLIKNSYIYIQTSWPYIYIYMYTHHIAGNFRGRKLSRITLFCGYPRIFSSQNLGVWHPLTRAAICKTFSMKIVFFTNSQKFFSLESFPLYGTLFCFSMFVLGM